MTVELYVDPQTNPAILAALKETASKLGIEVKHFIHSSCDAVEAVEGQPVAATSVQLDLGPEPSRIDFIGDLLRDMANLGSPRAGDLPLGGPGSPKPRFGGGSTLYGFDKGLSDVEDTKYILLSRKSADMPLCVAANILFRSPEAAADVAVTLPEYNLAQDNIFLATLTDIKSIAPFLPKLNLGKTH